MGVTVLVAEAGGVLRMQGVYTPYRGVWIKHCLKVSSMWVRDLTLEKESSKTKARCSIATFNTLSVQSNQCSHQNSTHVHSYRWLRRLHGYRLVLTVLSPHGNRLTWLSQYSTVQLPLHLTCIVPADSCCRQLLPKHNTTDPHKNMKTQKTDYTVIYWVSERCSIMCKGLVE